MNVLLAWIASISSGVEPLILKASSRNLIKNPWLFNVLWIGAELPLVIPFAILQGATIPHDWTIFLLLGACHAGFFLLYTASLYKIDASAMAPLFSLRTVFALLISILVLHESYTPIKLVLAGLIVLASPFCTYDEHLGIRAFRQKYVLTAVASMVMLAFAGYFVNQAYAEYGFATTVLWQDICTLLFLLPSLAFVKWQHESWHRKKLLPFLALGILGFIYIASTSLAYGRAYGITSVIVSLPLSMIFVWLIGRWRPGWLEQHPPYVYRVRFIAAGVMVGSAIVLSVV